MHYFMSILFLQSSWRGRESWLLCFYCLVLLLWVFCGSSSQCPGLVCSVWLWYFLIILTFWCSIWIVFVLHCLSYTYLYGSISTHKNMNTKLRSGSESWLEKITVIIIDVCREHSGSVVECLTQDWGAMGSSLTGVTVLCSWARHIYPCLVQGRPIPI